MVLKLKLVLFFCGQGLQRENASVENIVRLAMEAGPVIPDSEDSPSKLNPFLDAEVTKAPIDDLTPTLNIVVKENDDQKASVFESLTRQSSLKEESQPTTAEKYVMSTPAAKVRLLTLNVSFHAHVNGYFERTIMDMFR